MNKNPLTEQYVLNRIQAYKAHLQSIVPSSIRNYDYMICGGYFRSWWHNDLKNTDIDLFFPSVKIAEEVNEIFKYICIGKEDRTSSYSNLYWEWMDRKFNVVKSIVAPDVMGIVDDFDYKHTINGWDAKLNQFYITGEAMASIIDKTLEVHHMQNFLTRKPVVIERRYCKMVFGKGLTPNFQKSAIGINKTNSELRHDYGY